MSWQRTRWEKINHHRRSVYSSRASDVIDYQPAKSRVYFNKYSPLVRLVDPDSRVALIALFKRVAETMTKLDQAVSSTYQIRGTRQSHLGLSLVGVNEQREIQPLHYPSDQGFLDQLYEQQPSTSQYLSVKPIDCGQFGSRLQAMASIGLTFDEPTTNHILTERQAISEILRPANKIESQRWPHLSIGRIALRNEATAYSFKDEVRRQLTDLDEINLMPVTIGYHR